MSMNSTKIENLIKDYLLEEGILKEKIANPNFDFGFIISYPPGPKSQNMTVYKPKNKNSIYITIRIQFLEDHIKALNSLDDNKRFQFYNDMRKYFLSREVFFAMDLQKSIFEIYKIIYLDPDGKISKDTLYKRIQRIFYCYVVSNLILEEHCFSKESPPRKLGSDFNFSLYS